MDAGALLIEARHRAGLSRRELARRAGTSQATLGAYEQGRICPSVAVLDRVVTAAGFTLTVRLAEDDEIERGRILEDLLDLAEQYPWADPGPLTFPVLPTGLP